MEKIVENIVAAATSRELQKYRINFFNFFLELWRHLAQTALETIQAKVLINFTIFGPFLKLKAKLVQKKKI